MNLKTYSNHLLVLNKVKIEKNEINAISKFLNSVRFASNCDNSLIKSKANLLLEIIWNRKENKPYKLSKEQTVFGINWLKNYYLTKKGIERKRVKNDFYNYHENEVKEILDNFKEFRFLGFTAQWDNWRKCYTYFIPVYQVISKDDRSFNYAPVYMGKPLIDPVIIDSIN